MEMTICTTDEKSRTKYPAVSSEKAWKSKEEDVVARREETTSVRQALKICFRVSNFRPNLVMFVN